MDTQGHRISTGFLLLPLVCAGAALFSSCTPSTSLTGMMQQSSARSNKKAVNQIARETEAAAEVGAQNQASAAEGEQGAVESQVIVGAPDRTNQIEIVEPEPLSQSSSPIVLASVHTTTGHSPSDSFDSPASSTGSSANQMPQVDVSSTLRPSMVPPGGMMMVRTTAYCHKEADSLPYGNLNAAGTQLKYGGLVRSAAADWSRYPVGTRFRITGLPYEFVVDDYGSALVGTDTIDIYQPTFAAMNSWGVRNVPIQVIEWGSYEMSHRILDGRKHVPHANHVRTMLREIERRAAVSAAIRRSQSADSIGKVRA